LYEQAWLFRTKFKSQGFLQKISQVQIPLFRPQTLPRITRDNEGLILQMDQNLFILFNLQKRISNLVAPARSTRNVPLQHAVSQRKGFWYDQHIWVHLLADKKNIR